MTKVFVVMGNDYPAAVFSTETEAELYVKRKKLGEKAKNPTGRPTIYWRYYEFELDKDVLNAR